MTEQSNLTLQRTRNPWGQGEKLRTEILVASARLLSELGGEEALTIRGVARAVGIAPASIYQHFADKAALVAGLIDYDYQQLATQMQAAHDSLPVEDAVNRLRAQMGAYCRFAIDNPGHYRLMLNNRSAGPPPVAREQGPLAGIAKLVIASFEECEAAGYKLRVPARKAAIMVSSGRTVGSRCGIPARTIATPTTSSRSSRT
jgi:AcrR family transcriptional regulator